MPLNKVLYTAHTHAIGGREGNGRSDDGRIDVKLSSPGGPGNGTNPEQLFGIGYSACFMGAMKAVAPKLGVTVPGQPPSTPKSTWAPPRRATASPCA